MTADRFVVAVATWRPLAVSMANI